MKLSHPLTLEAVFFQALMGEKNALSGEEKMAQKKFILVGGYF